MITKVGRCLIIRKKATWGKSRRAPRESIIKWLLYKCHWSKNRNKREFKLSNVIYEEPLKSQGCNFFLGLVRYCHPTDEELKELALIPKPDKKKKHRVIFRRPDLSNPFATRSPPVANGFSIIILMFWRNIEFDIK